MIASHDCATSRARNFGDVRDLVNLPPGVLKHRVLKLQNYLQSIKGDSEVPYWYHERFTNEIQILLRYIKQEVRREAI